MPSFAQTVELPKMIKEMPYFPNEDRKELFLIVVGGLVSRLIALKKPPSYWI